MTTRFFAVAKGWGDKAIQLPQRGTKGSAGYDFRSAEDVVVPSMLAYIADSLKRSPEGYEHIGGESYVRPEHHSLDPNTDILKPVLVPTGVKASMYDNEFLGIYNRSSNAKKGIHLANHTAVIDKDYFENPDNDGHIMLPILNLSPKDLKIKKGDRIAQGIFHQYQVVENELEVTDKRTGGWGSTGTN